jgi:hypothetical protein
MNMQAVLIRAAILLVMCFGLSIAMTRKNPVHAGLLPSAAPTRAENAASQVPAVVLATINVRPSAAEIAAAMNGETTEFDDASNIIDTGRDQPLFTTNVSLRSLRLDMPYYSFGRALPRVSKE